MTEPYWVDPAAIRYKITPVRDLHGSVGGDWDIERRIEFRDCLKARAIKAHFIDGAPWLETELFEAYARRLQREGRIGRNRSIHDLAQDYERRFGKLYAALQRDGFRADNGRGKRHSLPAFLIGRNGEVFIGNQGNHRLAMAQVLGLETIAGRIVCRHENWTG